MSNQLTLLQALMNGHDYTEQEAEKEIIKMRQRVDFHNEDPAEVLYEYGLEPDYAIELVKPY
jgi:hypothetical protein